MLVFCYLFVIAVCGWVGGGVGCLVMLSGGWCYGLLCLGWFCNR